MRQILSFSITLSVFHVETCVIPLRKAVFWGFISFLHLRALSNLWGRYDLKTHCRFFGCNCFISSHRIKCNTSIESFHQYFHFSFLHQQASSNLRERYDPKTEKKADFILVTVSFLHIESSVIPLLKALIEIFLSILTLTSSE